MTSKVSILVPVYNVSKYIERCAHSLFQQTFEDIEYVFVNDCTPDNSIEKLQKIIDRYPTRKSVKIINHEKNRGLAAARNTAIDNSTGKYILHIDSDDYIELDMVEQLYQVAEKKQADITVCDFFRETARQTVICYDFIAYDREERFRNILTVEKSEGYIWNKLIRRELYELPDCRLPAGLDFWEDLYVVTLFYYYTNKIAKVDKPLYHYVMYNENALTNNSCNKKHYENVLLFWRLLDKFLQEKGVFEKYLDIIEKQKLQIKITLIFNTKSATLRHQYAEMFAAEEKKRRNTLKLVEKVMFFCAKRKYLLWGASVIRNLLLIKGKILKWLYAVKKPLEPPQKQLCTMKI
ncbi:MAG: glycosyltransferase [Prevotellaceae bacterium]|jgi:glycosyltransferase involved in cell wall biosynthesis|nr:glycosyltransferase [Prevotellaceae bacterium]